MSFLRFCLVGALVTAIDITVLLTLRNFIPLLLANMCSTLVALLISFHLNRTFTFHQQSFSGVQFTKFLLITLVGIWVLQPLALMLVLTMLGSETTLTILTAKAAAISISLSWNYLGYKKFVFSST